MLDLWIRPVAPQTPLPCSHGSTIFMPLLASEWFGTMIVSTDRPPGYTSY